MSMRAEPRITKLSLLIEETEVIWSVPYNDVTVSDLLDAFVGLLRTQTFHEVNILGALEAYVEDHKDNNNYED